MAAIYERIEFDNLKTSPLGQCIGMWTTQRQQHTTPLLTT